MGVPLPPVAADSKPSLPELCFTASDTAEQPVRIRLIKNDNFEAWQASLSSSQQRWLQRQQFTAQSEQWAWLEQGGEAYVVAGWDGQDNFASLGGLAMALPPGNYQLHDDVTDLQLLGWALGAYQFARYKSADRAPARLSIPDRNDHDKITHAAEAIAFSRDLINTAAADLCPSHLAAEATALAEKFAARCTITSGDALLDINCGAIHAVGRAADDPPCLIDIQWQPADAPQTALPKIVLVGKGVTFDSGGLNLKPASGMRWMKKDMGGAATALGLAWLIMAQQLPIELRVLIPAAENAVAGNAFRPGDVLHTHKGLTVEIDNTDAEGRLLLCDALSIACEQKPQMVFDFATLTGSARSAVGTEVAAMFCNNDTLAADLAACGTAQADPVWPMPLHDGYEYMLDSKTADVVNSAASPYAGSVTAALFLRRFVTDTMWSHFDIMAFNARGRPGHPEGGEAMGLRAVYRYLEQRFKPT